MNSRNTRFSPELEGWRPDASGTLAFLQLVAVVRRHMRWVLAGALLLGVGAFLFVITRPRTYTASVRFLLQTPKMPAGASGLAAQLGLSMPMSDPALSPAFYSEMVRSRAILSALADSTFEFRDVSGAVVKSKLADVYRVRDKNPALRRDALIGRLQNVVSVRTSLNSGIIGFSVATPAPDLAPKIATALLEELNRFNTQRRQSQAAAERKFTERRLAELGNELRQAERMLEGFLSSNRVMNAPQLRFEQDRLSREVELRRTIYSSMAQSHEQAKIEEVRDTPQITVIQQPEVPSRPDPRMLLGKTLAAATFGAILGLLLGYFRERVDHVTARSTPETVSVPDRVPIA
jgi:uncharacterized protein involved in exopolysaccharide biosynthesis